MRRTGRRRDGRLRVEIPGHLITLDGKPRIALCDVSQSGARLRSSANLQMGEDGILTWLGYEAFGRIVWIAKGYAGIEFEELLPPDILIKTRDIVDQGLAPKEENIAYEAARNWYTGYDTA